MSTDRLSANQIVSERYQILSLIGEGGMGWVYRVRQILINREFALKTIKKSALSDIVIRRFQQEAKAAFALKHENIIGVNDFGILDDETPFLVMELISGETLGQRMKRLGRLDLNEALPIFIQVCNGMYYAHKNGVVHRDMKPNNIMLVPSNDPKQPSLVKIVDFGIAKFAGHEEGEIQALTKTGEIFGSPLYMSPEQCLGSRIDNRSDIYSLGCVFFECLTGLPPFIGENALSTMMKHQSEDHASLSEASLGLRFPAALENIVQRMLAKRPADRYQSLDEVALDLQSLQAGSRTPKPLKTTSVQVQDKQLLSISKTQFAFSLIAASVISSLISVSLVLLLQSHKTEQHGAPQTPSTTSSSPTAPSQTAAKSEVSTPPPVEEPDETKLNDLSDEDIDKRLNCPPGYAGGWFHFGGHTITEHALERLSKIDGLEKLGLTDCNIVPSALAYLPHMKSLRDLNLAGSNVDDGGAKFIAKCRMLRQLNVSSSKISDKGLVLLTSLPELTSFAASYTTITDASLKNFGSKVNYLEFRRVKGVTNQALKMMTHLKLNMVEVDGTSIDDEGLKLLTPVKSLTQIGLGETNVTPDGVRAMCQEHPRLQRINIDRAPKVTATDLSALRREFPGIIFK